jgi:hypothetical protein
MISPVVSPTNNSIDWQFWLNWFFGGGIVISILYIVYQAGCVMTRFKAVEDNLKVVKNDTSSIRDLVITIKTALLQKGTLKEAVFSSASPKRITEAGLEMLSKSGFKTTLDTSNEELFKKAFKEAPKSKFDVEEMLINYMLSLRDDSLVEGLKKYIFETGTDITDALIASSLYLRDIYLKKTNLP